MSTLAPISQGVPLLVGYSTANTNIALKIENGSLYLGNTQVPIDRAKSCSLHTENATYMLLECDTASQRQVTYTLELFSNENVRKCFDLLVQNTDVQLPLGRLSGINAEIIPTLKGKASFIFANSLDAAIFESFAEIFFPKDEFEHKLVGQCYSFTSIGEAKTKSQAAEQIQQPIYKLDNRVHGHALREMLYENKNTIVPGTHYPADYESPSNKTNRNFIVSTAGIQECIWIKNGIAAPQFQVISSDYKTVEAWVNARDIHDSLRDKKAWENCVAELKAANEPEFEPMTNLMKIVLAQFDHIGFDKLLTLPADKLEKALGPLELMNSNSNATGLSESASKELNLTDGERAVLEVLRIINSDGFPQTKLFSIIEKHFR